ncbi:MAG TPA: hypothetical protein VFX50_06825 [Gemmatimonadales bacterium]|nr:hypothetical protein [Gemmatimonadales bacterium]
MSASGSALAKATAIGTVAQLAMVLIGHREPDGGMFALLGTTIAGFSGFLYPFFRKGTTVGDAARGGTAAGGIAAVLGIIVSHLLGDVPLSTVAVGGGMSALAGAIGGVIGQRLGAKTSG